MANELMLHRGARAVTHDQLSAVAVPPATETWFPLKHVQVLDTVEATLEGAGFHVSSRRLALSRGDARFFGTLDLEAHVAQGVHLAVGIRNSFDKSFPLGFCAGNRVFVCDNLAFRSELLVTRKHTKFGSLRFEEAIAGAVVSLQQFQSAEGERIRHLQNLELSEDAANSYMLQAFEQGLVNSRLLPMVIKEWREPRFDEFQSRTMFSLLNAFTTAMGERKDRQPAEYAAQTMRLQRFLAPKQE